MYNGKTKKNESFGLIHYNLKSRFYMELNRGLLQSEFNNLVFLKCKDVIECNIRMRFLKTGRISYKFGRKLFFAVLAKRLLYPPVSSRL